MVTPKFFAALRAHSFKTTPTSLIPGSAPAVDCDQAVESASSYPLSLLKRESISVDCMHIVFFITSSRVWLAARCRILVQSQLIGCSSLQVCSLIADFVVCCFVHYIYLRITLFLNSTAYYVPATGKRRVLG